MQRNDLAKDRDEHKHYWIARRMLARGGRRDIFLGVRECQGYVKPCIFGEGEGAYDTVAEMPFALMVHGITYADEQQVNQMSVRLWQPVMRHGVVDFPRPEACPIVKPVREQKLETFNLNETIEPVGTLFNREGGIQ